MKTFLLDILPKIQRFSKKLDDLTLLTNQHWVSIDNILSVKTTYIFRSNNELLISTNGKVDRAKWEYLGNKSILIDKASESYLFKHGFFDENVLALKIDSRDEYAVFVNENKYEGDLNSIIKVYDFLTHKYLHSSINLDTERTIGEKIIFLDPETVFRETTDNKILKIISERNKTIGARVYINEIVANDDTYIYKTLSHKLIVKNGVIIERYFLEKVNDYLFEKKHDSDPVLGDKISMINGQKLYDGKYKYTIFKSYYIENGVIIK